MTAPAFNSSILLALSILGNGINVSGAQVSQWQNGTTSPGQGPTPYTLQPGDNLIIPPQSPQNVAQICIVTFPGQAFGGGPTVTGPKGATSDAGYANGTATNGVLMFMVGTAVVAGYTGAFYLNATGQTEAVVYFL